MTLELQERMLVVPADAVMTPVVTVPLVDFRQMTLLAPVVVMA